MVKSEKNVIGHLTQEIDGLSYVNKVKLMQNLYKHNVINQKMLKFSYDMSWCEASSEQMKDEEETVFWLMSAVPGSMEWERILGVKNLMSSVSRKRFPMFFRFLGKFPYDADFQECIMECLSILDCYVKEHECESGERDAYYDMKEKIIYFLFRYCDTVHTVRIERTFRGQYVAIRFKAESGQEYWFHIPNRGLAKKMVSDTSVYPYELDERIVDTSKSEDANALISYTYTVISNFYQAIK